MFNKNKQQDTAQRFTIKKFKFGAASVLIGTVFAVFAGTAQATESEVSVSTEPTVTSMVDTPAETSAPVATEASSASEPVVESSAPAEAPIVEAVSTPASSVVAEATPEAQVTESTSTSSEEKKVEDTSSTESEKPAEPKKAEEKSATPSPASKPATQEVLAQSQPAPQAPVTRVAGAPYKVTYTDVATKEVVYTARKTEAFNTDLPVTERATVEVTASSEVGQVPDLAGYRLAEGQAAVQSAIITERGGRNNIFNFNVIKEDVAAAAGPDDTEEGYTGFRSIASATAQANQPAAGSGSAYDPTADNAVPRNTVSPSDYLATQPNPMEGATSPFGELSANLYNSNFGKMVRFLNFSQNTLVSGSFGPGNILTEGMVFEEEFYPGMRVRATVMELKPFRATETYREMATEIDRINGTNYATTVYNPDAVNGTRSGNTSNVGLKPKANMNDSVISSGTGGLKTGTQAARLDASHDGADVGVKLRLERVKADGTTTPVNIFVADGEQLTNRELTTFTTDGTPWSLVGEYRRGDASWIPNTPTLYNDGVINMNEDLVYRYSPYTDTGIVGNGRYPNGTKPNPQAFINPYPNAGLGTQVFSSSVNFLFSYPGRNGYKELSAPVVASEGVNELGIYIDSAGKQSALLGFIIADRSDAPESYGQAVHGSSAISGDGTGRQVPSLGRVVADIDRVLGENAVLTGFYGDDDGQGENDNVDSDEGEAQLAKNGLYEVVDAGLSTYTLTVVANANGPATASAKAWIDFNNNGVFDNNEGSAVQSFSGTSESTLTFTWTGLDLSGLDVSKLGARIRVGTAADVARPTGMAATGEVEDFQVAVKYPPKGSYDETTGLQGQAQTGNVTFTAQGTQVAAGTTVREQTDTANAMIDSLDTSKVGIVDPATGNLVQTLTVAGQGTYTILPSSTGASVQIKFQPEPSFTGRATGVVIRSTDVNGSTSGWTTGGAGKSNSSSILPVGQTWDSLYIPNVTIVTPAATPATTTDKQGVPQTQDAKTMFTEGAEVVPINNSSITLLDAQGNPTRTVTVEGQGTYTVDENGVITFTPLPNFTGTATPVSVRAADANGREVSTTYTPSVTPITPTETPATTTDKQGVPQTQDATAMFAPGDESAPINNSTITLVDADGNPTKSVTVEGQGTYTIDENGQITFTPLPDFIGTATPVTVKATDKNGTPVTTTYTPTVTPVKPTATPAKTSDKQGVPQTQSATSMFTEGDEVAPINEDSITLIDPKTGNPTKSVTVEGQGTYTIDENGQITFTPVPEFTGTATPVTVKATDKNGTPVTTTYTPTVTPVKPTATPAKTSDKQGVPQTQSATSMFTEGDETAPINEDSITLIDPKTGNPTKSVTVEGQGTYTIDENGQITFTPLPEFTGTATPVTVKATDKNGTPVTTTYTPTVTPVKPTATPAETSDKQGVPQTQSATSMFTEGDETAPINEDSITLIDPKTGNPTKSVTVEGQGTYTIDENGQITFTPLPEFTGTATPVTVKATDKNGTPVTTTYTPTVTPVKPTATPAETSDKQGVPQTQSATSMFTEGDETAPINEDSITLIDPKTGNPTKSVTVEGQGTYTIDENGQITFTPLPEFTGTATPVTVKATDKNGTPVTTTYTPTVTPVKPTATPAETSDKQGVPQTQSATSMFTEGDEVAPINEDSITLIDPKTGNPTKSVTVEGQGTYTIDENGQITFTPLPEFTGTATPVTVKATDKNGTPVTTTYTPTVTPVKPTATPAETSDKQGVPQTQSATSMFTEGDETAPINEDSITLIDPKTGNPTKSVTVEGQGTYTIDENGQITFTPLPEFTGTATPVTVKATDKNGTPVTTTYTPTVTPVKPTATPAETSDKQGVPQTQSATSMFTEGDETAPINEDSITLIDPKTGNPTKSVTVEGQGTYTIDENGQITFTPVPEFTGTATPVTVKATDKNGTPVTTTYTPTVTPVKPTATPAETSDKQGVPQTQSATSMFTEGDETAPINEDSITLIDPKTGNPTKSVTVEGQGTYTIDENGQITFTPVPEFTGTATPVTVKATDKNGTPVTTTYTPTVTPVKPTATPAETSDKQGVPQTQSATSMFTEGDETAPINEDSITLIDPKTGNPTKSVTVEGQGTYTIDENGQITFTPVPEFTGTATPVTVKATDKNGTPVTTTYTPTVTPVKPTATPAETSDKQGVPQTQSATSMFTEGDETAPINEDSITLIDPKTGNPTKSVTVEGQGTYTIDENGQITFTPVPEFTGTATPVTVKATDKNGTPVTTTYTPTVTPVKPTATPAETSDKQGVPQTQSATSMFTEGDETAPINKDSIRLIDPKTGNPTRKVTVEGQGTYTIDENGQITFTPVPEFTGTATPVTVKAADKNGTSVTTTYTPTVTPVKPTATPAETSDKQGVPQTQSATSMFTEGDETAPINKDSIRLIDPKTGNPTNFVTVAGEGTYTIDKNGQITFTPEPEFTGTATPVTVKATDKNGTPVTTTYTPTVTPVKTNFVDESGKVLAPEEIGKQPSQNISGYEVISSTTDENGDTVHVYRKVSKPSTSFVDENGEPIAPNEDGKQPSKDIPGYEITGSTTDKDGNVIHTYRKVSKPSTSFVDENGNPLSPNEEGNQPSKSIPDYELVSSTTDENGNTVHVYRKVSKPSTSFVDENGNPLSPNEEGNQPSKSIPDYELVSSTTDENGNTVHVYRKVSKPSTSFVDENGEPIAPSEDGKQPSKDIPGYEITGSTTDKDGNVIHTYRKVSKPSTSFVDENGEPIAPSEDGKQPSKDIPGYEITGSTTDKDGNVIHTYRKVSKPSTSFVDENGNPLSPNEEGNQPSKSIPDYELVSSTTDENGNTVHVYRKVSKPSTSFVDENGNPLSPNEEGNQPSKSIPDYELVSSTTDENGNTVHVYRKVSKPSTSFVDENGNPLSPNEEGNQPSKSIPDYELVSSTTDENGNTVHVYRKVVKPSTSFVDENGEPIAPSEDGKQPSKDIPGYEITGSTTDKDGNVIHTYRKVAKTTTSFVDENGNPLSPNEEGNQPSKSIPDYELVSSTTDENGNTVHVYRKVSKPSTSFVDENGNPLSPNEEGNQPSKSIPDYELVSSTTDENGNTVHVYRKVAKKTTSFVDENGNPIVPNEEGNQPSKDLPEYELVSSTTDENGNTVHTYRKVAKPTTTFVDEEGNPVAPQEDGKQPSKEISGYEIVSSTTDENGNVVHVYRKVAKKTTSFVDENGNPIVPNEEGNQPSKDLPEYELVSSTTDENGNTVHTYRKVAKPNTTFVDENGNPLSPNEEGNQPSKSIPDYELVSSTTDENGNTVHVYRKVAKKTTSFVDENGNPIVPNEEGNQPSKDLPEYELVSSTTDENGNTVHTYRKVAKPTTTFVDEEGNPVAPQEDGKQPSKEISGYEIVSSTTDENGNVVHVYRKVAKKTTSFVDENGNPIVPNEEGNQPSKDLPEYELVSSTTDENGNTVHTYRKVAKPTTTFVDEDGNPVAPQEDGKQPSKEISGYEIVSSTTDENGNVVHVYRKVAKKTTSFMDENGNPIVPNEEGNQPSKDLPEYELVSSTTDENGNTVHTYRKVAKPITPAEPVKPSQPVAPAKSVNTVTPVVPDKVVEPSATQPAEKPATKTENKLTVLPNTGTESTATASAVGVGMILASLGLVGKRRRKED